MGGAGEVFLGGDGLARGYANDVALTAEKFVPDPFSNNPGERLYRTGDRARFLEDGSIEFLGRIDQQVKIRGYRIEPAEVSFALLRHPSIQACVVTVAQDSSAQKRLIAYTVSSDSLPLSAEELITFLRKSLPEYMIPRVFISVDKLPLTANGKIDFRKLPKPEPFSAISNETFVAPQTEVQTVLANIWSTVLGLPEIGVFDNFFDLGGHSLLATQVIARVRQSFNVELPLRALFDSPTVASFCESIEKAKQVAGETTIEPISLAARPARRAIKSEDGQFLRN